MFVKLEKYMWKVREVGFLKVVMGLDKMKMKKEKVQEVVDWLVLRSVKNIQKFLKLENYYELFVKNFAGVTKPLYKMIRKDMK